jgi:uncharacterized protein YecA (UPF0149 family)
VDAKTDEEIVSLIASHKFPPRVGGGNKDSEDVFDSINPAEEVEIDELTSMFNDEPTKPTKKKEDDGEIHIDDIPFR